jgi:HEAT repeat-containing protein 5
LIELDSDFVYAALDRGDEQISITSGSNYRDEPVAFFFIIYGLCFHTLLRMLNRDDMEAKNAAPTVLDALTKFIRPSISGNAVYKSFVFAETTDLLDRLILMESIDVQTSVLTIATNLAKNHPVAVKRRAESR